jgi:hypothetical protein
MLTLFCIFLVFALIFGEFAWKRHTSQICPEGIRPKVRNLEVLRFIAEAQSKEGGASQLALSGAYLKSFLTRKHVINSSWNLAVGSAVAIAPTQGAWEIVRFIIVLGCIASLGRNLSELVKVRRVQVQGN